MAIGSVNNSTRLLNSAQKEKTDLFSKLASGKRITKAADDPAGLAIAEQLATAIDTLGQAQRNIGDVQSVIDINDGALQQIGDIGSRLKELATESSNGTLSDAQRQSLNQEYQSLTQEAQRITQATTFNGVQTLTGQGVTAQVGTDASASSSITVDGTNASSATGSVVGTDISTQAGAQAALGQIDQFVSSVASARGAGGAASARLDVAYANNAVSRENSAAAESRIRDLDYAEATSRNVANDIRSQAALAVSAQANQSSAVVLQLLK